MNNMTNFFKSALVAGGTALGTGAVAMAQSSTSDPLSAATSQISTWTPIVGALLVAAFGICVLFKGLKLGKRGVASV